MVGWSVGRRGVGRRTDRSFYFFLELPLETALEITYTQKPRIRPLIIEAPNFKEISELQTPSVF